MRHRSNATTYVFVKINLEYTLPTTRLELVNQLQDMPNEKIGHRVARFGSSLRRTHSYGTKVELNSQI